MEVKIVELRKTILENNDVDADRLREETGAMKTFYLNVMSSPGSGKTTAILKTLECIGERIRAGVMEADIDSDVDAIKVQEAGYPAIQVHTGGMCHLDADMSRQGLRELGAKNLDLVILENVGNLVCPAEFDTGANRNAVILSVPEGDDKPLKYPLMFEKADAILINKIDAMEVFDFDIEKCKANIAMRNPDIPVFPVSAETGEGFGPWVEWLLGEVEKVTGGAENE